MPSRISAASEARLRSAMNRLLTGVPTRTDGRLIKENLCREAGVSRATMNRATDVLDEWDRRASTPQPRGRELEELRRQLAEATTTIQGLRARIAEQHLTLAATAVVELHAENQILNSQDPTRTVAPLRSRSRR